MRSTLFATLACLVAVTEFAGNARAQGAALSTNLDCSVRAAGMGQSSNGVFWGGDPDYWGNPSLLGYHSGVRYEYGSTQLVPDLADDVFFKTDRFTVAAYGLGFAFAGKPIDGVGSVFLDYGYSDATGPTGEDLGTFHSYEDISSWGMGLSLGRATQAIWQAAAQTSPSILRYADVGFGFNHKDVVVQLVPEIPGFPGTGPATGKADDSGWFFRVSPYNSFDGPGYSGAVDRSVQLALDVSYGISTINRGQPTLDFGDGSPDQMIEEDRKGWAAHIAVQPVSLTRAMEDDNLAWLARSLSPTISFGAAWDDNTQHYVGYDYLTGESFPAHSDITKSGWELTLLNVFSLRHGHVTDPDGQIDGDTDGWSLGYAMSGVAGFRYDQAKVPQATDPSTGLALASVDRHAWTFFIDPLRYFALKK